MIKFNNFFQSQQLRDWEKASLDSIPIREVKKGWKVLMNKARKESYASANGEAYIKMSELLRASAQAHKPESKKF